MITLGVTALVPVQAQDDLVYVAVEPCRIVDTRNAGGVIPANNFRNFRASGVLGELAAQGGVSDCLDPKTGTGQRPLAVVAYVLAVPSPGSGSGVLTAYPSNLPPPPVGSGSTVNFAAQQVIGNTTTITLCDLNGACPTDGEFAVLARNTDQHVVVDVQGYFYPANVQSSGESQFAGFTTATFDGGQGVVTYTNACDLDYSGSHMCTSEEFLNSKTFPATSGDGWIRPTYVPVAGSSGDNGEIIYVLDMSGVAGTRDSLSCIGWASSGNGYYGLYVDFTGKFRTFFTCCC